MRTTARLAVAVIAVFLATLCLEVSGQQGLSEVNSFRRSQGLPPLQWSNSLASAAARHSNDMARRNFLSHTGSDGSSMGKRITEAGGRYRCSAENVAQNGAGASAGAVMEQWKNSPGHRANMMNRQYTHVGIARAVNGGKSYWTMKLGGC